MSEILSMSSIAWSLMHAFILFAFFYVPKYPRKKFLIISSVVLVPLVAANAALFMLYDFDNFGRILVFSLIIPSFCYFFIMSKYKDFRFVFTFCISITIAAEILIFSMIINSYLTPETNLVSFILRIISFPIVEFFLVGKFRKHYFEIQKMIKAGWSMFSVVSFLFFLLLLALVVWPTSIVSRPDDMPAVLVFLFIIPLMYVNIFHILSHQNSLYQMQREQELWHIQSDHMQHQLRQIAKADERVRFERHNLRHRLQTIDVMLQKGAYEEAREYIQSAQKTLDAPLNKKYCQNAILDAVFTSYFRQAEEKGIRIESALNFSENLPVEAEELSVVIANALENAIIACEKLPEAKRHIKCRCIDHPQFILQISNPYNGDILTDADGRPLAREHNHGIGTRSILAFCEKNNAIVDYKISHDTFAVRILIQN